MSTPPQTRAELIERCKGHTPGPWWTSAEYYPEETGIAIIAANTGAGPPPGNPTRGMVAWASEILPENAELCERNAAAIASVPDLIDALASADAEIERLKGALDQAEETLDQILDDMQGDGQCVCLAVKQEAVETLAKVRTALGEG